MLWRRFHSPTFPYFNNVFRSPDYPRTAWQAVQFPPASAWDILRFPLYWLFGGSRSKVVPSPAAESDPRDARFALALAGVAVSLATALFRRRRRPALLARPETGLLLACAIGYLVWLFTFPYQRYLIPVEILCGAVLLVLTDWVATGRWRVPLLLVIVTLTLVRVHVATWGRLPWQHHWATVAPAALALQGRPLIFLTFGPSAFVALSLPVNARYVNLACGEINLCGPDDTSLTRQLRTELETVPPYTLYAVIPSVSPPLRGPPIKPNLSGFAAYGLRLGTHCQPLAVAGTVYPICDVLR